MRRLLSAILSLAALAVMVACGAPRPAGGGLQQQQRRQVGGRLTVTKAEYGERWPLTVDTAEVECLPGDRYVVHANGTTYGLNGLAMAGPDAYPSVRPIWRDDPNNPGSKVSIAPLIEAAKSTCR